VQKAVNMTIYNPANPAPTMASVESKVVAQAQADVADAAPSRANLSYNTGRIQLTQVNPYKTLPSFGLN